MPQNPFLLIKAPIIGIEALLVNRLSMEEATALITQEMQQFPELVAQWL